MAAEGADLLDVGGELTRPGHAGVDEAEGAAGASCRRSAPCGLPFRTCRSRSIRPSRLLRRPRSRAGADAINDIPGVAEDDAAPRGSRRTMAARSILMHNRAVPRYGDPRSGRSWTSSARRSSAPSAAGVPRSSLIVDPGIGFGKTAEHNLELLRDLGRAAGSSVARTCSGLPGSRRSARSWTCPGRTARGDARDDRARDRRGGRRRPRPRRAREPPSRTNRRRDRPRHLARGPA